ncbi:MAG: YkgJ family cysteine cluster protein, partial [Methanothrix sp.]|nr:YkgJ family cysteine cluster protein [Methanothrix sp.]
YDGHFVKVEDSGSKIILDLPVLKSKKDTACVLYDPHQGCTVHPARPIACRLFPFRVEEETTPEGDITLRISYNATCPGVGKGKYVDKRVLERLVTDQFLQRSQAVAGEVQTLAAAGRVMSGARVYRTHPGRNSQDPSCAGPK